jgi:hypothetical protein
MPQGKQPNDNPRLQLEGANAQMLEAAFNQTLGKSLKSDPTKTVSVEKRDGDIRVSVHSNVLKDCILCGVLLILLRRVTWNAGHRTADRERRERQHF